ncbi:hypothetical protein GF340_06085 [Candidatus Peregrinibacteria bacterium]|nr:hypothetical protein [Candidatus Peregrinibacteria bacterium]
MEKATRERLQMLFQAPEKRRNGAYLNELANEASKAKFTQVRTVLGTLIDEAVNNLKMLPQEFVDEFDRNNLADVIVHGMVEKLISNGETELLETECPAAMDEIAEFLGSFVKVTNATLKKLIEDLQAYYGGQGIDYLRSNEFRARFSQEIKKYMLMKLETDVEDAFKEDPDRFVLDYFFSRIIYFGDEESKVNRELLMQFLAFLDKHQYRLEDTYMLLYKEIKDMREVKSVEKARMAVRMGIDKIEGCEFLDKTFNYHKFYSEYIKPAILEYRESQYGKNLRLVDITRLNPKAMAETLIPGVANNPIKEKVAAVDAREKNAAARDRELNYQLRSYFNYRHSDRAGSEFVLDDSEMRAELRKQVLAARAFIEYVVENGLSRRREDDPIHTDCRYIDEILHCSDFYQLVQWLADPKKFIEKYPAYKTVEYKRIAFECRRMIEWVLMYRKYVFREDFKTSGKFQIPLQAQIQEDLEIEGFEEIKVPFRIKVAVDASGQPLHNAEFKVVKEGPLLDEKPTDKLFIFDKDEDLAYIVYPVEQKKFFKTTAQIPTGKKNQRRQAELLFYAGNCHPLDKKSTNSYLSSVLRANEPSDLLRETIIVEDAKARAALMNFLYENYSSGNFVSIKDNIE